jgi:REP-associated tyrosine transposase
MARHSRLIVPGLALHIRQRGVDGMACFKEEADRLVYLSVLRDLVTKAQCELHAYCLMTNHVHLLITPTDEAGCSTFMRELGRRYVPYFNKRHGRTGTLWDGRFRSCLVESREYVLACYRYIERNPVRAGMVGSPSAYRWSSFKANIGEVEDRALRGHAEYAALGCDAIARHAAYRRFCLTAEEASFVTELREATDAGLPLVGQALRSRLEASGCRVARAKPGPQGGKDCGKTPLDHQLRF